MTNCAYCDGEMHVVRADGESVVWGCKTRDCPNFHDLYYHFEFVPAREPVHGRVHVNRHDQLPEVGRMMELFGEDPETSNGSWQDFANVYFFGQGEQWFTREWVHPVLATAPVIQARATTALEAGQAVTLNQEGDAIPYNYDDAIVAFEHAVGVALTPVQQRLVGFTLPSTFLEDAENGREHGKDD